MEQGGYISEYDARGGRQAGLRPLRRRPDAAGTGSTSSTSWTWSGRPSSACAARRRRRTASGTCWRPASRCGTRDASWTMRRQATMREAVIVSGVPHRRRQGAAGQAAHGAARRHGGGGDQGRVGAGRGLTGRGCGRRGHRLRLSRGRAGHERGPPRRAARRPAGAACRPDRQPLLLVGPAEPSPWRRSRSWPGWADVIIAGGAESMSMVPMTGNKFAPNPTWRRNTPSVYIGMGLTAENVARRVQGQPRGPGRLRLRSHQRAVGRPGRRASSRTRSCRWR